MRIDSNADPILTKNINICQQNIVTTLRTDPIIVYQLFPDTTASEQF